MTLEDLEARFPALVGERTHHRDQRLGVLACSEALAAARMGNYGVGAVLVDPGGEILERVATRSSSRTFEATCTPRWW